MEKFQRNERIAVILKTLLEIPQKVITLRTFADMFGTAKSTTSEDIDLVSKLMDRLSLGKVETISGVGGGVRYIPLFEDNKMEDILEALCNELSSGDRILSGGFLYMLDIIYNPQKLNSIGRIFASKFYSQNIDYVITVETKGIPLAFMTAKYLNVPLVIVRHYNEATDGASVNINYISGSSKKIQTMALSLRALKRNSRLLFIDDFMKGGGTAKGIIDISKEFECEVSGIGVLIATKEPVKKMVEEYYSLFTLENIDDKNKKINLKIK